MPIEKVYAQLSSSDLERSVVWYEHLFERRPDARPMDGLAEWHHDDNAGLQVFKDSRNAGRGTLTLIVSDLRNEYSRLVAVGLEPSAIEPADTTSIVCLRDPDQNLVVLAQPGRV